MSSPSSSKKRTKVSEEDAFFQARSFLTSANIPKESLESLYELADSIRTQPKKYQDALKGKVVALAFLEPSTRTMQSFAAATSRLGGSFLSITQSDSSLAKGETLSDTMKCLECYSDAIVIRHSKIGSAKEASDAIKKPLINAGDGAGEHPTQALLDLYTILRESNHAEKLKSASNERLTVTFLGDLKYGRTVHSLAQLLAGFSPSKIKLNYVAKDLQIPSEVKDHLSAAFPTLSQEMHLELSDKVLSETDVLYVTRVQKERFTDLKAYEEAKASFLIDAAVMKRAPKSMTLLHPLPRVGEILPEVDQDERSAYFRQMENGMWVRAALLIKILK